MRVMSTPVTVQKLLSDPILLAQKQEEAAQKARRDGLLESESEGPPKLDVATLQQIASNSLMPAAERETAARLLRTMGATVPDLDGAASKFPPVEPPGPAPPPPAKPNER